MNLTELPVLLAPLAAAALLAGCASISPGSPSAGSISKSDWGSVDGTPVHLWTLTNGKGMEAQITDYGTIVVSLKVPDAKGEVADIVLGRSSVADYVAANPYFGCTAGRCANRIAGGKFTIDGQSFQVATNNAPNHLHGGVKGFDKVVWKGEGTMTPDGPAITFTYRSKDGEEGYPGNVDAKVVYTLTTANELRVDMSAVTDAPTPVNLAHHSYWNLAGHASGDILGHVLEIPAVSFTPVDSTLITTSEITPVKGTPFDFTAAKPVGEDIGQLPATATDPGGYDLNYVLDRKPTRADLWLGAVLRDPKSGRTMTIWTDQPGIQFYSGNFLDGVQGKDGATYEKFDGLCLETQAFPDSVNKQGKAGWPNVVLRPGQTYRHRMVHAFGGG
jgi:aldose 1-epimerase